MDAGQTSEGYEDHHQIEPPTLKSKRLAIDAPAQVLLFSASKHFYSQRRLSA